MNSAEQQRQLGADMDPKLGEMVLSGVAAGPLLEALRDAALDFTDDKED